MTTPNIPDERGFSKRLKRRLPPWAFEPVARSAGRIISPLPHTVKYGLSSGLAASRAPYSFLGQADYVVQVGSARDILPTGRSRFVHFSRRVPRGRVLVLEADPINAKAAADYVSMHGLSNVDVVHTGVWESTGVMTLRSSAWHPASNVLSEAKQLDSSIAAHRQYELVEVPVGTLDDLVKAHLDRAPRLVSITTNGAERNILKGMSAIMGGGCEFISLASTGHGFGELMDELGYEYVARDDRGYCFRRVSTPLK